MFFRKQKLDVKQLKLNKFIFDVKQLKINKFIFDVNQLKMNRFIKSISDLIISASNATLEVPLLRPCSAHAMLIEDLLNKAYQYVITARLQSDPVEDVFPGFLSICEKSKTPRGFCNTVLYLKKILTFGNRILHLKIWSVLL